MRANHQDLLVAVEMRQQVLENFDDIFYFDDSPEEKYLVSRNAYQQARSLLEVECIKDFDDQDIFAMKYQALVAALYRLKMYDNLANPDTPALGLGTFKDFLACATAAGTPAEKNELESNVMDDCD